MMEAQPEIGCSCGGHLTILDRAHVAVKTDRELFSRDVLLRAAYKFTDRCYILFASEGGSVTTFLIGKRADADITDVAGAYCNELIDQQLRVQLDQQFAPVRTLIAAQAFAEGNLLDPDCDDADYQRDPRGIGEPR
jgi:His-Xaa-Ser system protein HxsD